MTYFTFTTFIKYTIQYNTIQGYPHRSTAHVFVRGRGIAPPRLTAHAPQACLATSYNTRALENILLGFSCFYNFFLLCAEIPHLAGNFLGCLLADVVELGPANF
mgnify:CR=1